MNMKQNATHIPVTFNNLCADTANKQYRQDNLESHILNNKAIAKLI
jgi:hypothetical protein